MDASQRRSRAPVEHRIAALAREIASGTEARRRVCATALEVTGAAVVALREPDGAGELAATASVGRDDLPTIPASLAEEVSGTALAYTGGRRLIVPDVERDQVISRRLLEGWSGRSLLFEPVVSGDTVLGVLALGWDQPIEDTEALPLEAIELLAGMAATAIERSRLEAKLELATLTDPLTGLGNRHRLEEELPRELARAARYGYPVSVALLDLDYFRAYNDEHGHQAGDRLLKNAGAAWADQVRDVDLVVRLHDDVFAALLPGAGGTDARDVVERLRAATPGATCSAGVASWDGMEDAAGLLGRAEQALEAAKHGGRDRSVAPTAEA